MDGLYDQFRLGLHSVWTRRWLALGVAAGLCLVGWLVVALIPNSYESKARVFAQMQSILPDKIGITPLERQADLLRVKQSLTSSENLEKVVRRTDLNQLVASDADMRAQIEALRTGIKITAEQENLFEISATVSVGGFSNAQNAKLAHGVVQSLLDLFVEENLAGDRAEMGQSLTFLDNELKQREEALREAERQRVDFEQKFLGILPGEGTLTQRLSAARAEIADLDRQIIAAQSSAAAIRGQMAGQPATLPTPGVTGSVGGAAGQIAALESQLAQYAGRGWTGQHPDVIATRQQIERLRPDAARERAAGAGASSAFSTPNPAIMSLRAMAGERDAQASAAQARKNQLQSMLADFAAKEAAEPQVVAEQARLDRDYDVLKRQYDKLLEDREQVRLRSDVQTKTDSINFQVLVPPSRPTVPSAPNRPLFLSIILFVALGAGAGTAFALGELRPTFATQARLERASGIKVIGAISEVLTPARVAQRKQRLKYFAGAGGALVGAYAVLMLVEFWQRSTVV